MRRLYYASGQVLLGDRLCSALLGYTRALAEVGKADVVTIPVMTDGGASVSAALVVGPASQFLSIPTDSGADEPVDDEASEWLIRLTLALRPRTVEWSIGGTEEDDRCDWEYGVDTRSETPAPPEGSERLHGGRHAAILRSMKRITYNGGSIVTGNAITEALLEYTTTVADAANSVTVDITVLEENGETSIHTILLSPASQFDVADVGGIPEEEEEWRFPVPEMPQAGIQGKVESNGDAVRTAQDFDKFMAEIDDGLGQ